MSKLFVFSRVNVLKDFVIVFIIAVCPFFFFLYTIVPENTMVWRTNFFIVNLSNTGNEVAVIFWYFSYKFLTTLIFCIWFVTCKHWWRYVILAPIFYEINKVTTAYYEINYAIGGYKHYYSFLLSIPIIILLFVISKKLNYYSFSKSINKQIDDEINELMRHVSNYKKEDYKAYKTKLILLRKEKIKLDKKEYLIQLIKLREDFDLYSRNK
ncbi:MULTISPECIES: hypothetical protein [unclassified Lacinutrix]